MATIVTLNEFMTITVARCAREMNYGHVVGAGPPFSTGLAEHYQRLSGEQRSIARDLHMSVWGGDEEDNNAKLRCECGAKFPFFRRICLRANSAPLACAEQTYASLLTLDAAARRRLVIYEVLVTEMCCMQGKKKNSNLSKQKNRFCISMFG